MSPPILGVDIGGTKVAVGIVGSEGKILAQGRKPMVASGTAQAGLDAVIGAIDSMMSAGPKIGSIDYRGPRCNCGKRGCIEVLASGPAIGARARAKAEAEPSRASALRDLAQGKIESITSETVARAFAAGDPMARETLTETTELLTCWLGNIVDLLDPDVIVIGGGVAAIVKPFFPVISETLPGCCVNPHAGQIPLRMAHHGADAGIAGGAALCA